MLKRISKLSSAVPLDPAAISSVLSAIRSETLEGGYHDGDDDDDDGRYDFVTIGNLSYQRSAVCDGCFCPASCPDETTIIRRIIRWVKIIARSKHGMTVVCGILPLVLGLAIGFYVGRRWEQKKKGDDENSSMQAGIVQSSFSWMTRVWRHQLATLRMLQAWAASLVLLLLFTTSTWNSQQDEKDCTKMNILQSTSTEESVLITEEERREQTQLRRLKDPSRYRQSGVDRDVLPQHIAFIMDGNRRYGKSKYKSVSRGHMDGGYKLRDMVHWCLEECVREITVYAFSTENWNRSQAEIDALMSIFCQQCEELRKESVKLQIVVRVLSTDADPIPHHVKEKLKQLEEDTKHCQGNLFLNVCLSYGSRGEIVGVCKSLAEACRDGDLAINDINEQEVESRLLTRNSPAPDILLRTSGEERLSNFLLWQCAYTEFFFLSKHWPDLEKEDLIGVLRSYALGRKRRFGK
ncbi:Isoprenyl transferase [Seminavis robusta]|uniref:Isoprenyl transferase n=1 Tax=Seminavis robusta TaxID=568900 RepID=A0A9N8I073_9STRA|nr:Isoprenyl transferase [Seminavis robusta]|eukprot:Sro2549_g330880.1 Isoprenyl transferase (464) ;mRNA; f:867-2346